MIDIKILNQIEKSLDEEEIRLIRSKRKRADLVDRRHGLALALIDIGVYYCDVAKFINRDHSSVCHLRNHRKENEQVLFYKEKYKGLINEQIYK